MLQKPYRFILHVAMNDLRSYSLVNYSFIASLRLVQFVQEMNIFLTVKECGLIPKSRRINSSISFKDENKTSDTEAAIIKLIWYFGSLPLIYALQFHLNSI